ncbi:restriction endonuclease subunit S [Vibrio parahaemolyticus]|uniref:restriction endonuclease subunit S n=1 Tax=Vibrio parahaemolyticus TaxID=670 RepID=UPI0030078B1C
MSKFEVVPELRFSGFNKAWSKKRLKEIGTFLGGGTPSKTNPDFWTGLIPWVSSSDITDDSIHQIKVTRFITEDAIAKSATKLVPENTILLVSRVGVGKLAVTTKNLCTSQDFTNFSPSEGDVYFLAYYLKSKSTEFLKFNQGMAIQGFTKDDISNFAIYIPQDLEEQQKVADCLSSIDDLITTNIKKLESLKLHKKGLMQKLFPEEEKNVPELRFSDFEGDWKPASIAKMGMVVTGSTPSTSHREYYGGEHLFVSPADISENRFIETTKSTLTTEGIRKSRVVQSGSVLFVCIGSTIGKTAQVKYDCATNQQINAITAFQGYDDDFLYYLLSFHSLTISELAGKQAVPIINKATFSKVVLMVPEEKEQKRIADILSSIDELIHAQADKIETLKEYKKGLMQKLFPEIKEYIA